VTELRVGRSGFDSRQEMGIFLFPTASRPALGPTQPHIQWVPGVLSSRVKRPGREVDHWLPCSAEVKNAWSYTSIPSTSLGRGAESSTGTTLPLPHTYLSSALLSGAGTVGRGTKGHALLSDMLDGMSRNDSLMTVLFNGFHVILLVR
jgi:hypothetical protein